ISEAGVIEFAARLPEYVNASEISELLDPVYWEQQGELRHFVESELHLDGEEAYVEFRNHIKTHGRLRLQQILQLPPAVTSQSRANGEDLVKELMEIPDSRFSVPQKLQEVILDVAEKMKNCVIKLGTYIGDLVALLQEEHQLDQVLISGGVSSGGTGCIALKQVRTRLATFSQFKNIPLSSGHVIHFRKTDLDSDDQAHADVLPPILDCGTFGAGVRAASQLLLEQRQAGLTRVRQMVQSLTLNDRLEVAKDFAKTPYERVSLTEFALPPDQLNKYLEDNAMPLGIVPASVGFDSESGLVAYSRQMSHHHH
ncbi:MAG: hypothetical protein KDA84_19060, partial [Planctomycetaceae bacterium]|nr:hypothetical protein [Planctomycetaceae bacterium]